jgi:predicted XRE-type DNA-binding protein
LVAALIEKETIEQEEIEKLMGVPQTKNTSGPGIEIVG